MSRGVAPGGRVDYHFPGPLRNLGFSGEVAFRDCVYGRFSGKLSHELFKDKEEGSTQTLAPKP